MICTYRSEYTGIHLFVTTLLVRYHSLDVCLVENGCLDEADKVVLDVVIVFIWCGGEREVGACDVLQCSQSTRVWVQSDDIVAAYPQLV
jgi:hypothetical protein